MKITPTNPYNIQRVNRATADVLTGVAVAIYTIATGRILLWGLIGEVTTGLAAGTTPDANFQSNPTTGTTTVLCGTLSVASDEIGTLYAITGVPADAMLTSSSGGVRDGLWGNPIVIPIGAIEFLCDENITGSISFQCWWMPLDDGATLVAA